MKSVLPFALSVASLSLLLIGGCKKEDSISPADTCADERTLEVYQDIDAVVVEASGVLCFVVDKDNIAKGSYEIQHFLVPVPTISFQGHTWGERAVISGRKKSCYGLVTLPNLRNNFGYKLELNSVKYSKKGE
jgi:hypothetical protein